MPRPSMHSSVSPFLSRKVKVMVAKCPVGRGFSDPELLDEFKRGDSAGGRWQRALLTLRPRLEPPLHSDVFLRDLEQRGARSREATVHPARPGKPSASVCVSDCPTCKKTQTTALFGKYHRGLKFSPENGDTHDSNLEEVGLSDSPDQ